MERGWERPWGPSTLGKAHSKAAWSSCQVGPVSQREQPAPLMASLMLLQQTLHSDWWAVRQSWAVSCPCEERSLLNEILPFLKWEYEIQIALSASKGLPGKEMRMLQQTEVNAIGKLPDKWNMFQSDTKNNLWKLYINQWVYFLFNASVQDWFFLLGAVGCGIVYLVNTAVVFVLVLTNQITLMIHAS